MIIFNTTYHADHSRKDEFISWLKNFYIPAVLEHGALQEPQLTRIFAENEEEGISLSLQFKSPDTDARTLARRVRRNTTLRYAKEIRQASIGIQYPIGSNRLINEHDKR